ncbi:TPA: TniQ family protein [Burkholderia cepacia]|uniref:TniQ family protein n=1 Tax=Burkholderia cepacia TaxID=292 RepID=UPI001CF3327C|nr:TniQ family protein [Burkholderia cepacia]MCA8355900.1 TniQ family protein [Burkholderia cepacia]HDR9757505.1 TniQ family protein [Burkholderia cepacia ATCC 25416]HDV6369757.1 TniQ family protein [Burkholderia cepacia]
MPEQHSNHHSLLNPVAPIGIGTPEVESLISYFCRLAASHCYSSSQLSRKIAREMGWKLHAKFIWQNQRMSGLYKTAIRWSTALSKLTANKQLDQLTLLPWRNVISSISLISPSHRWCSVCLTDDRKEHRIPYFRLAWDIGVVTACARHKTILTCTCPDCGRTDGRHNSAFVVPGWCVFCGAFLGDAKDSGPAESYEVWIADQIGSMLAEQAKLKAVPTSDKLFDGIRTLIKQLDFGESGAFARRIGLNKVTVHYWIKKRSTPTLAGHLRVVSHTGLELHKLLTGDLANWSYHCENVHPSSIRLPRKRRRRTPKDLDWDKIRSDLLVLCQSPVPISVAEAARRLDLDPSQIRRSANQEAKIISSRWKDHMRSRGRASRAIVSDAIVKACFELAGEGKTISLRNVLRQLPPDISGRIHDNFSLVKEVRAKIQSGEIASPEDVTDKSDRNSSW